MHIKGKRYLGFWNKSAINAQANAALVATAVQRLPGMSYQLHECYTGNYLMKLSKYWSCYCFLFVTMQTKNWSRGTVVASVDIYAICEQCLWKCLRLRQRHNHYYSCRLFYKHDVWAPHILMICWLRAMKVTRTAKPFGKMGICSSN